MERNTSKRSQTAGKDNRLVNYNLQYDSDAYGNVIERYALTFSSKERPSTNLIGQGDHSTSMSTLLEEVICIINDNFPSSEDLDKNHISILVHKLYEIPDRSEFFLKHFFPADENEEGYDKKNIYILGQFGKDGLQKADISDLLEEIERDLNATNEHISGLKGAIKYIHSDADGNKAKASDVTEQHIKNLKHTATHIRNEYNGRVAERASRALIEHLNKGFCVSFEKMPPMDEKNDKLCKEEEEFMKNESKRITMALGALREKKENNDNEIVSSIVNLLHYPPVSKEYHDMAVKEYAATAARISGKVKRPGRIGKVNKRTNDEHMFCYVVANHIETVFTAFSWLNELDEARKARIIDSVIQNIITPYDRSSEFAWHLNKDAPKKILAALNNWHQLKEEGLKNQHEFSAMGFTPGSAASSSSSENYRQSGLASSIVGVDLRQEFDEIKNESSSSETLASSSSRGAQMSASYEELKRDPNTMSSRSIGSSIFSDAHDSSRVTSSYNTRLRSKNAASDATASVSKNMASSDQDTENDKTDKKNKKR